MASVIYADNGGSHMFSRRHVTGGALLALVLLAAIPVAAEARTFKVDGRVTGPPTAKGGAVTVSFQLTGRAGRALKLGTRRVRVRFRRARLPLSGAAGVRRLAPRALRPGDRLKGVTSLSKKARLRMRYRARPTLKLRRPRVIRRVRRSRRAPVPPSSAVPLSRTPQQIVMDIGTRATALSGRIGEFGSFSRQIERLETLRLPVGLAGVTLAFESLTAALDGRSSTDAAFEPLLAEVEALAPGADWLGPAMGAVNTSLSTWRALGMIGDAVETLAVEAPLLATQIELLKQIPGVLAQVIAIEEALMRIEGRLDAVEAASGALSSSTRDVTAGMASLTDAVNALATDVEAGADLASTSAGVDALATDVAGLASRFGALQASMDQYAPALDGLLADAAALEGMVDGLEALGMGGG
jgi:outer membrane murein-binding lipoprotein Lpp